MRGPRSTARSIIASTSPTATSTLSTLSSGGVSCDHHNRGGPANQALLRRAPHATDRDVNRTPSAPSSSTTGIRHGSAANTIHGHPQRRDRSPTSPTNVAPYSREASAGSRRPTRWLLTQPNPRVLVASRLMLRANATASKRPISAFDAIGSDESGKSLAAAYRIQPRRLRFVRCGCLDRAGSGFRFDLSGRLPLRAHGGPSKRASGSTAGAALPRDARAIALVVDAATSAPE
jgi:hypothetical protein